MNLILTRNMLHSESAALDNLGMPATPAGSGCVYSRYLVINILKGVAFASFRVA